MARACKSVLPISYDRDLSKMVVLGPGDVNGRWAAAPSAPLRQPEVFTGSRRPARSEDGTPEAPSDCPAS